MPGSVLASGTGVAGSCLAWWLDRYGYAVTLVEQAHEPCTGGYVIDFWASAMTWPRRWARWTNFASMTSRFRNSGSLIARAGGSVALIKARSKSSSRAGA